jgi:hypothetical protein
MPNPMLIGKALAYPNLIRIIDHPPPVFSQQSHKNTPQK